MLAQAGGNFVGTAGGYTGGKSEEMLGKFVQERSLRRRVVLATKFTFNADPGNPNGGGNGRKNIYRALEGSLRRLRTDNIDLYWLHAWDTVTPVEEVVSTLNDLVRAGGPGGAELGRQSTGHHFHNHWRHQAGTARLQSGSERVRNSRPIPKPSGAGQCIGAGPSLRVLRRTAPGDDQRRFSPGLVAGTRFRSRSSCPTLV
jgi:hypothetical protein